LNGSVQYAMNNNNNNNYNNNNRSNVSSFTRIQFKADVNKEQETKYHNWVEACAKTIKACSHTMDESVEFFLTKCEAIPLNMNEPRMKNYKYSVVMNYLQDKLDHKPSDYPFDSSDEVKAHWSQEQGNIRKFIMDNTPEYFGIHLCGYYLPQSEHNAFLYEEFKIEMEKLIKPSEGCDATTIWQDICFYFETTTEDIQCENGGRSLYNQLTVFRGVSEEDIELRNARFIVYLNSMRELGNL